MTLTQRLLLGSLLLVSVLVGAVVVVIDQRVRSRIARESAGQLAREARLVAAQWGRAGTGSADSLANMAGAALGHRVTLVDSAGRVIGDSEFDEPALSRLENHARRPEVVEASRSGLGSSRRVSPSAGDEELYVAVRGPRGGVARVSVGTRALEQIFDEAQRDVFLAGLLALILAMATAWLFSRAVSRPIVELSGVARALAAGDLSRRPALSAPGEVGDLAAAVHRLAEQLAARLTALESERSLLTTLVDSLNEGAVVVDARRQVTRMNERARQLLDVRDRAVPFAIDFLPREPALRDVLHGALGGRAPEPVEVTLNSRTLALTARPLPSGGAVLAVLDLTATRRLEAVRRDFVANVSHELRTPLTVVGGFAETLVDDDPPAEQRRHFAQMIRASTRRMQRIVDDLLDLSRIESGGWVPNPVAADVSAAAADVFTSLHGAARAKNVRLESAVADRARTVRADPTALRQILSNLVENAVRHTAGGSVTVYTRPDGGGAWVGVRDTGSGIPPEHLPRIFERFYRVDPARSREAGGTGLGLSIVRHLVEAHGGRVRAESQPGRGTTVEVFLPDRDAAVTPP